MLAAAVIIAWLAIGIASGILEARRGHWGKTWVLGAILGPFAVPFALEARKREHWMQPRVIRLGDQTSGALHVLAGLDGSETSLAAASTAVSLFGARLGAMTVATVLDFDTAEPHGDSQLFPEPWDEERAAEATLESAVNALTEKLGFTPTSVLLAGRPADALESYAIEHGCDVLVTGCRGRGLTKSVLGSCATRLARKASTPVLLVPEAATRPATSRTTITGEPRDVGG